MNCNVFLMHYQNIYANHDLAAALFDAPTVVQPWVDPIVTWENELEFLDSIPIASEPDVSTSASTNRSTSSEQDEETLVGAITFLMH
jgi:hypothetical protein